MPNYDYLCERCGHRFEVFQSMNDAKLTDCPEEACDGPVKRLLGTGAGLIFKGSGFYETDYRSPSYQEAAKKEQGGGKESKDGGESAPKKESAPAAKESSSPAKEPASSGDKS